MLSLSRRRRQFLDGRVVSAFILIGAAFAAIAALVLVGGGDDVGLVGKAGGLNELGVDPISLDLTPEADSESIKSMPMAPVSTRDLRPGVTEPPQTSSSLSTRPPMPTWTPAPTPTPLPTWTPAPTANANANAYMDSPTDMDARTNPYDNCNASSFRYF